MYVTGAVPIADAGIGTATFEPAKAAEADEDVGANQRGSGNCTSTENSVTFKSRWSDTVTALTISPYATRDE